MRAFLHSAVSYALHRPIPDEMVDVMNDFICPKCNGVMRSYERNGITIEQCADCRGIFLDRGELDRMIDTESRQYEQPVRVPQYQDDYKHKKKKRQGFLSDFFDD
jgi:Zn-finger nucleic acid-binding protein